MDGSFYVVPNLEYPGSTDVYRRCVMARKKERGKKQGTNHNNTSSCYIVAPIRMSYITTGSPALLVCLYLVL